MRNEDRCVIRLTHSTSQNSAIFYHFQIQNGSSFYQLSCRYSKLRLIAPMLPKTYSKFPQACHLTMAISTLIGNKAILEERYQKLNKYFEEISKVPQLASNKGFERLLEESQLLESYEWKKQNLVIRAPRICGKKICEKQFTGQLLIVVV